MVEYFHGQKPMKIKIECYPWQVFLLNLLWRKLARHQVFISSGVCATSNWIDEAVGLQHEAYLPEDVTTSIKGKFFPPAFTQKFSSGNPPLHEISNIFTAAVSGTTLKVHDDRHEFDEPFGI